MLKDISIFLALLVFWYRLSSYQSLEVISQTVQINVKENLNMVYVVTFDNVSYQDWYMYIKNLKKRRKNLDI